MTRARALWEWLKDHPSVVVILALGIAFWAQSYNSRTDLVHKLRAQCESALGERYANMEAWYGASLARQADAKRLGEGPQGHDAIAADVYLTYVRHAMRRADATHSLTWPDPEAPGGHPPYAHPLGVGTYSCEQAYPDAALIGLFG